MAAAQETRRIWYQSFTDPEVDAPYFSRLAERIRDVAGPGFDVVAHGTPLCSTAPVAVLAAKTAIRLRRLNGTGASRTPGQALPSTEAVEEFLAST